MTIILCFVLLVIAFSCFARTSVNATKIGSADSAASGHKTSLTLNKAHIEKIIREKIMGKRNSVFVDFGLVPSSGSNIGLSFTTSLPPSSSPQQQKQAKKTPKTCIIEVSRIKMTNGLISFNILRNSDESLCPDSQMKIQFTTLVESGLNRIRDFEPLLKGIDFEILNNHGDENDAITAKVTLFLSPDERSSKAPHFLWTCLQQEILSPNAAKQTETENNNNNNQAINAIANAFFENGILRRLFPSAATIENSGNNFSSLPYSKLGHSGILNSVMEMTHDFFRAPSFPWFLRISVAWFNLFCDISLPSSLAASHCYVSAGNLQQDPVFGEIVVNALVTNFPCKQEIFEFVQKKLSQNTAIPFLFALFRNENNRKDELEKFLSPITQCLEKEAFGIELEENTNLLLQLLTDLTSTDSFGISSKNRFSVRNTIQDKNKIILAENKLSSAAIASFLLSSKFASSSFVSTFAGLAFTYRLIEHITENAGEEEKRFIFANPHLFDFGLHPLILNDLFGIPLVPPSPPLNEKENDVDAALRPKRKEFAQIQKIDFKSCLASFAQNTITTKKASCHVVVQGYFVPKFLDGMSSGGKATQKRDSSSLLASLSDREERKIQFEKQFPLFSSKNNSTSKARSSVYFSDINYKATTTFPLSPVDEEESKNIQENGDLLFDDKKFECEVLHKKCWECLVTTDETTKNLFVTIANGVTVREFRPSFEENRCLDCGRIVNTMREIDRDNENDVLSGGTQWRCTLQCKLRKPNNSNNADL